MVDFKEWVDSKAERNEIILLDGSFSTELEKLGVPFKDHPGWTAYANFACSENVQKVYEDYIKLGCDVITTNTYHHGLDLLRPIYGDEAVRANFRNAVNLAHCARFVGYNEENVKILVSIGSYGVTKRDGSEYTGAYIHDTPRKVIGDYYEKQCAMAQATDYDGVIFETVPTCKDISIIVEKSKNLKNVIISLTLDKLRLRDGCPIDEALELMQEGENIIGVGINCSDPRDGVSQIEEIVSCGWVESGKHVFIYPNSGETFVNGSYEGEKAELHKMVRAWHDAGAVAVGGCCRVGMTELNKIKRVVHEINNVRPPIRLKPSPSTLMPASYFRSQLGESESDSEDQENRLA